MADTAVHTGENALVAYKMMHDIANVENVSLSGGKLGIGQKKADRAYILRTYWECREVVAGRPPKGLTP